MQAQSAERISRQLCPIVHGVNSLLTDSVTFFLENKVERGYSLLPRAQAVNMCSGSYDRTSSNIHHSG